MGHDAMAEPWRLDRELRRAVRSSGAGHYKLGSYYLVIEPTPMSITKPGISAASVHIRVSTRCQFVSLPRWEQSGGAKCGPRPRISVTINLFAEDSKPRQKQKGARD